MKLDSSERERIIQLVKQQVVPAVGCTEPVCVALCVSRAVETLGVLPAKIDVYLSANILKNAMGVGIPGTGMVGLPIAIALGALIGKSEYGLEVLRDLTPEAVETGKVMIEGKSIHIALKENVDKLYIEVCCHAGNDSACVIICREHTNIAYIEKNNTVLVDLRKEDTNNVADQERS